jgi:hypothetical protein
VEEFGLVGVKMAIFVDVGKILDPKGAILS